MTALDLAGAPVAGSQGAYRGAVGLDDLRMAAPARDVASVADATAPAVPSDATLDDVMELLAAEHAASVPVLDEERRVVGVVGTGELVQAYRRSLLASLRSLRTIFGGSVFLEERIHDGAPVIGRTVAEAGWPTGTVVVAVQRGHQLIFPGPSTPLKPGDLLSLVAPAAVERRVHALLGAAEGQPSDERQDPPPPDRPVPRPD